jgi:5-histidylcysteine sulfoxide synthase
VHTSPLWQGRAGLSCVCADDIDPYLQKMFETGVDEMSWDDMDDMQDDDYAWPTVAEAEAFRVRVKAVAEEVIRKMPDPRETPITMESPYWALIMGFEHERIHIETSSVLIRQLPIDCVIKPSVWKDCPFRARSAEDAPVNKLVRVPPTRVVLGKPNDFPEYGWDNEYGKRVVDVPSFTASRFLVTNAEFLPFVLAGGYKDRKWWVSPRGDDEGWRWATYRNASHPSFWVATKDMAEFFGGHAGRPYQKDDGHVRAGEGTEFKLRTELDIIDMPWDWPVEVNYLEARAFLNWKACQEGVSPGMYRLPTEAEYHACRDDPCPFPEATTGKKFPGQQAGLPRSAQGMTQALAMSSEVEAPSPVDLYEGTDEIPPPDYSLVTSAGDAAKEVREPASYLDSPETYDVVMNPAGTPGNTNLKWLSTTPVHLYPPSTAGFYDTHGNVWEYVEDHFAGLPDFKIHYLYDDFSTPCFDGWHTNILGGSWVSTGDQSSNFGRYAFRRHFFQHLGFRYVKLDCGCKEEEYPGQHTVKNLWEGMGSASQEVTNGYADPKTKGLDDVLGALSLADAADYPKRVASTVEDLYTSVKGSAAPDAGAARVMHVNCGAGGVTMALCKHFGRVVGSHPEEPVLRQGRVLQHHGQLEYERFTEGILTETTLVPVDKTIDRSRAVYVEAASADFAPALAANGGRPFDLVVVDSALTAMTQPLDLVRALQAPGVLVEGGVVVVLSDHHWDASVTPRNSWIGGFNMNGEGISTRAMLERHFGGKHGCFLVETRDVPVLQYEDSRRFTLKILDAMAFVKTTPSARRGDVE